VWTDTSTDGILRVFRSGAFGGQAWSAEIRSWRPGGPTPQPGDLVLTFGLVRITRCRFCKAAMTPLIKHAPPRLSPPVFRTSDGQLSVYRVF
jgi:hypothetical protein